MLYPLSLLRNLSALRYTAVVSFVCILYTCSLIVIRAFIGPTSPTASVTRATPTGVFVGIPITVVSFTMHYNTPRFYFELKDHSIKLFSTIALIVFGITLVIYEGTATSGYFLFGESTKGDILENFTNSDIMAFIARVAITIVMLFSYPLAFNSLRTSTIALLPLKWQSYVLYGTNGIINDPHDNDMEKSSLQKSYYPSLSTYEKILYNIKTEWPHGLVTLVLVVATILVAVAIPQVEKVLGYKGALGGTLIVFIIPGIMYFALKMKQNENDRIHGNTNNSSSNKYKDIESNIHNDNDLGAHLLHGKGAKYTDDAEMDATKVLNSVATPLLWSPSTSNNNNTTHGIQANNNTTHGIQARRRSLKTSSLDDDVQSNLLEVRKKLLVDDASSSVSIDMNDTARPDRVSTQGTCNGMEIEQIERLHPHYRPKTKREIARELVTTKYGFVCIFYCAWGFAVMILGTITTAKGSV